MTTIKHEIIKFVHQLNMEICKGSLDKEQEKALAEELVIFSNESYNRGYIDGIGNEEDS